MDLPEGVRHRRRRDRGTSRETPGCTSPWPGDPTTRAGSTGAATTAAKAAPFRGYWLVTAVLVGTVLALFGLTTAAGIPLLTDPLPAMRRAGGPAALIGVGLLVSDVALPVPSSAVMVAHGALFGVLPGAVLSVLGGTGATVLGFALGRRGRAVVARLTTPRQRDRADRLLGRWGALAIMVTRPVPVLAETVAVLAGTSPMRWPVAALAGAAGTVTPALALAWSGAAAAGTVNGLLVFGLVLLLAGATALAGRLRRRAGGDRRRHSPSPAGGPRAHRAGRPQACPPPDRHA